MRGRYVLSYLDFQSCLVIMFASLFVLSFLKMADNAKGNIVDPAEIIIEATWPDYNPNDVDLWVEAPDGSVTYFGQDDNTVVTLDRDDKGINNESNVNGQTVINPIRREVITVRSKMPGKYTVNVMMYKTNNGERTPVHVIVRKLNPYREVTEKTVDLETDGEEKTIVQFMVNDNNTVGGINTHIEKSLFKVVHP